MLGKRILLGCLLCFILAGCQQQKNQESNQEMTKAIETSAIINVYLPNEAADGFDIVEYAWTKDESLAYEQQVMNALKANGVLLYEVKLLDFSIEQDTNGSKKLQANLSKEFSETMIYLGSTGEYMLVGCVVNTFLSAYQADAIQLLVEGNKLPDQHSVYPDYLSFFDISKE